MPVSLLPPAEPRISPGAPPSAEDGLARGRRYWDPRFSATAIKVFPGEYYVTDAADEMVVTTLGSCVAACVRDKVLGIGGLNHFMLPSSSTGAWCDGFAGMRYGNLAMERLINDILKRGGLRARLEVKVFGAANLMRGESGIGKANAAFVESYLRTEGLRITARDLNGDHALRVFYFPHSGRASVQQLRPNESLAETATEYRYRETVLAQPQSGAVEFF